MPTHFLWPIIITIILCLKSGSEFSFLGMSLTCPNYQTMTLIIQANRKPFKTEFILKYADI